MPRACNNFRHYNVSLDASGNASVSGVTISGNIVAYQHGIATVTSLNSGDVSIWDTSVTVIFK